MSLTVVLLPGMDGSGELFADFSAALGGSSRVVSYPADLPLDYSELEGRIRSSLPTGEPFLVVAESFSGPLAIGLASAPLPGLRAIVLVCSFARFPAVPLRSVAGRLAGLLPFWLAPAGLVTRVLLGRSRTPALSARLMEVMQMVSPAVWRTRLRAILAVDMRSSLARIQVPVLYLRATEDRVVPSSASAAILEQVQAMKVVAIEGPHFLLQARPKECADAIRTFARDHGLVV